MVIRNKTGQKLAFRWGKRIFKTKKYSTKRADFIVKEGEWARIYDGFAPHLYVRAVKKFMYGCIQIDIIQHANPRKKKNGIPATVS